VGAGLALFGTARNAFLVQNHLSALDTRVTDHGQRIAFLETQLRDGVSADTDRKIEAGGPIIRRLKELEEDVSKLHSKACKCPQSHHATAATCQYNHDDFTALQQRVTGLEEPAHESKRAQVSEHASASLLSALTKRIDDLENGDTVGMCLPPMPSGPGRIGPRHVTPHAKTFFHVTQKQMTDAIQKAMDRVYGELDALIGDIDSSLNEKTKWDQFRTTMLEKIKARQEPTVDTDREREAATDSDSDHEDEKERDRDRDREKPASSLTNGTSTAKTNGKPRVTIQTDPSATSEG
ncbi:MAG TPA: hypothetical protein VFF04_05365, partial [Candidatus Babeliales bacterium]|nr:hypothetical protein [Candidatus Babeliales bacterium]